MRNRLSKIKNVLPKILFLFLSTFCISSQNYVNAKQYFVSPIGLDANSGKIDKPFKTINHAVAVAQAGDTVYLRGGIYRETIIPVRSGTVNKPIIFMGYKGENAILCGTDLVTGLWSKYNDKIYVADGVKPTWAVFVDGIMMQGARWPNAPTDNYFSGYATAGIGTTDKTVVDPNLPQGNLNGARVHIIPGSAWVSNTRGIKDYANGSFCFDSPIGSEPPYRVKEGNLYYIYDSLLLLDTEGEWYQENSTGKLYLWVPQGEPPANHLIEIATRKRVVDDNAQSYIQIKNLYTFAGGIYFNGCKGCLVNGVHQKYIQHYTEVDGQKNMEGDQNGFSEGSECTWENGSIVYSAGNGLFISGIKQKVTNMNISKVDYIGSYRANIQCEGSSQQISNNTCYDSGRYLIFHDTTKAGLISHNELYNAGLLTKDVGATYAWSTDGDGLEISYNYIHDIYSTMGVGIYLDDNTSNYLVHHNLVKNCSAFGIIFHDVSFNNRAYNNTLVDCVVWIGYTRNPKTTKPFDASDIENNLGVDTGKFNYSDLAGDKTVNNGTYLPDSFVTGGYQLIQGSGAIDKGKMISGITNSFAGKSPDVGAYEYGKKPWSAGATIVVPRFPYP